MGIGLGSGMDFGVSSQTKILRKKFKRTEFKYFYINHL